MKNVLKAFSVIALVAVIGFSMAACGDDDGGDVPPENKPVADRWGKWEDPTSTAKVDYSVSNDGVCTISVSGTAQPNNETDNWGRWKANAQYAYTAKAGKSYTYTFEAWTESGSRVVNFQYCNAEAKGIYFDEDISLTTTRRTHTVNGKPIAEGSFNLVAFLCADKLGTFYVKILSIQEVGSSSGGGGGSGSCKITINGLKPNIEYEVSPFFYAGYGSTYSPVSKKGTSNAAGIVTVSFSSSDLNDSLWTGTNYWGQSANIKYEYYDNGYNSYLSKRPYLMTSTTYTLTAPGDFDRD